MESKTKSAPQNARKKNVSDAEDFAATLVAKVKAACAQKPVSKFKSTVFFEKRGFNGQTTTQRRKEKPVKIDLDFWVV